MKYWPFTRESDFFCDIIIPETTQGEWPKTKLKNHFINQFGTWYALQNEQHIPSCPNFVGASEHYATTKKKHMFWNQFTYHLLAPFSPGFFFSRPETFVTPSTFRTARPSEWIACFRGQKSTLPRETFRSSGSGSSNEGATLRKGARCRGVIPSRALFWGWLQGSLYSQPKQCTIKGEILQIYHAFVVFHFPQKGNFMIPG